MIRRMATKASATCIAFAFCLAGIAGENIPQLLNYQGKLTDSDGRPVDAPRYITFEFYDAPFAGNLLSGFSEMQQVVVTKGIFNVLIGSATSGGVPASIFDGASVYLSVKVQGEEVSPRQRIASVAYAVRAARAADAARAGEADHAMTADNASAAVHAGSADTATTATSAQRATSADSAAVAGYADTAASAANADKLQGHAASDFALKGECPEVTALQAALADAQTRLAAIEARFWTLTIEVPQGNGSTSQAPGTYSYSVSTSSPGITATGDSGWAFVRWEGTAVSEQSTANPVIIVSGSNSESKTLKAVFAEWVSLASMCLVPAGTFTTSTNATVYLDAYYIDTYEVTNQLYAGFLNAGGNDDHWSSSMVPELSRTGTTAPYVYQVASGFENRPVRFITWLDAVAFCAWRSTAEGLPAGSYRLPTEAEWEKAAGWADGRTSLWNFAFQSETIDLTRANYNYNVGTTRNVGYYATWKSYYGCYDMTGNLWEWCGDLWSSISAYPSSTFNPGGSIVGTYRVLRGGSFTDPGERCLVGYRGRYNSQSTVGIDIGFRCARTGR